MVLSFVVCADKAVGCADSQQTIPLLPFLQTVAVFESYEFFHKLNEGVICL